MIRIGLSDTISLETIFVMLCSPYELGNLGSRADDEVCLFWARKRLWWLERHLALQDVTSYFTFAQYQISFNSILNLWLGCKLTF